MITALVLAGDDASSAVATAQAAVGFADQVRIAAPAEWAGDGAARLVAQLEGWLVVLGAGERLDLDDVAGARSLLEALDPGPVGVLVDGRPEVRIHPAGPAAIDAVGAVADVLLDGVRAWSAAPPLRLHLGCGPIHLEGWVNIDAEPSTQPDLLHDLRQPLPFPDGSAQLVYSEHFLEHLALDDGRRLLADCRRVLAPGGTLRVAMPDLAYVVERYLGDWRDQRWLEDPSYGWIDSPALMLNTCFRAWGHQHLYDRHELELRLREAGFAEVRIVPWGESAHAELRGRETRPDSLLVAEATA